METGGTHDLTKRLVKLDHFIAANNNVFSPRSSSLANCVHDLSSNWFLNSVGALKRKDSSFCNKINAPAVVRSTLALSIESTN